jgi:hypothetical protein
MVFIGLGEDQTNKNLHPGWAGINIRDADCAKGYGGPLTRRPGLRRVRCQVERRGRLGLFQRFEDIAAVVGPETPGIRGRILPAMEARQTAAKRTWLNKAEFERAREDSNL